MDKIYKGLIYDGDISVFLADTTSMVNKAIKIHGLSQLSAAALGRTLTVGTFMSSTLKNKTDKLSITVKGDGIGGSIVVCGNASLQIRGYIDEPQTFLPPNAKGKLDVSGCVGKTGRITVVRSMGLKEPYVGTSQIVSGEIAEDFASYYTFSEQQPTAMALGVLVSPQGKCLGAGGLVLQVMPGAKEESIDKAEKLIANFSAISTMIKDLGIDGIKQEYFSQDDLTVLTPKYKCNCSQRFIEKLVISMGKEEALDIIDEQGKIEVLCHFCNKKYYFDREDVQRIFSKGK